MGTTAPPAREHWVPLAKARKDAVDPAGLAHVLRAQYLMHTDRIDQSLDELRMALIYDEHAAWLQERLVSVYLATDHWSEAQSTLASSLRDNANDPGLNLLAGQLALDEQHFVQARSHLEVALKDASMVLSAAPSYIDARLWLQDTAESLARSRLLMDSNPGDADLSFALGGILEDHGQLEAARDAYVRTRAQRPSDRQAALAEVRVHELQRRTDAAADALVPLLAYYPDQPDLYAELVRLLGEAGRTGADAYRNEALRITEGDPAGRAALAAADIAMGQAARGVVLLQETVASLPQAPEPRLVLADWLRQQGQGEACLAVLGSLSETPPLVRTRAYCEALRGQLDAAMNNVVRYVELSTEPGKALVEMTPLWTTDATTSQAAARLSTLLKRMHGKINGDQAALARAGTLDALGEGSAALNQLSPVAQRHPDDIDLQMRLADLQARYGQRRNAIALLEDLVREDPFDPARLNALGFTLADGSMRLAEAAVWLHRALRLAPDDGAVLDSFGWLLLRQGQVTDALLWLRRAALRTPGDPDVLRHLGDALAAAGSHAEARGVYAKALQARPSVPLRRVLKQKLAVAAGR